MNIEITYMQFNELTTQLNSEVSVGLKNLLKAQRGLYLVEPDRLGSDVVLAAHTDQLLIEVSSAAIPVQRIIDSNLTVRPTLAKFTCGRQLINPAQHGWWQVDQNYGEAGHTTFCVNPLDIDGIPVFVNNLAKHLVKHLAPIHA